MSSRLSKATEDNLIRAVNGIGESVDDDYGADDLVKSAVAQAEKYAFTDEQIRVMCYSWNNGSVTSHRQANDNIMSKQATIPLLDADKVIETINRSKMAAFEASTHVISREYSQPIVQLAPPQSSSYLLDLVRTNNEKAATAEKAAEAISEYEEARQYQANLKEAKAIRQQTYDAFAEMNRARAAVLSSTYKAAEYFKRASHDRDWLFDEVGYAANRKLGAVGDAVVHMVACINNYTVKTANIRPRKPVNWDEAPFCWIAESVKKAEHLLACRDSYVDALVDNRYKIAKLLGTLVEEPVEPSTSPLRQAKSAAVDYQAQIKAALFSGTLSDLAVVGSIMGAAKGPDVDKDKVIDSLYNDLTDPKHDEEINRIRTQTMLRQLLSGDDILSTYDPKQVAKTYNDLSQLAPRSAKQPTLASSVLRKWTTQGGVEPFEVKELSDIEKSLATSQRPSTDKSAASAVLSRKSILGK